MPPFLIVLSPEHLADGNQDRPRALVHTVPAAPGLTLHGLRHSHKTWLIGNGDPESAQARRMGHHLDDRLVETYSHVEEEVRARLLAGLEERWRSSFGSRGLTNNTRQRVQVRRKSQARSGVAPRRRLTVADPRHRQANRRPSDVRWPVSAPDTVRAAEPSVRDGAPSGLGQPLCRPAEPGGVWP